MSLTTPFANLRHDLKALLTDDLAGALKTLRDRLPESADQHAIVVSLLGRLSDANKASMRNTISSDDYQRRIDTVRANLFDLLGELTEADFGTAVPALPEAAPQPVVVATALSTIPKFVIVYDLADSPQCQLLNKHLNVLKFTKRIRVYNVQETVGDLLASAEAELREADYLLVLVTVNIFNSPEWFDLVSKALEQGRRVIPILIEKADYDGTGLEKLRSLPSLGRAVSDFPNLDAAYADIVMELKKLLPK